ncbi:MAG: SWIM zinc finger family protein [Schwartzia sp. (in: firmicutes)]
MKKEFQVNGSTGNLYTVTFSDESGTVKASCTCHAGELGVLCKHVRGLIDQDEDVQQLLSGYGLLDAYYEYHKAYDEAAKVAAKMKAQAGKLKKKFERLLCRP